MTIGERIRLRRQELRMSADDLAEKLGKNRATVYRYESNDIENFPISILPTLADALHCSEAYLMGWQEKASALPDDDSALNAMILERFAKLTPENRLEVLEFLERKSRKQISSFFSSKVIAPRVLSISFMVCSAPPILGGVEYPPL